MKLKSAKAKAARLSKTATDTLLVIPCGAGEYVVKTLRAAGKGGYANEAEYIYAPLATLDGGK